VIVPAVAVNVAVVTPAAVWTLAGTVRFVELLESANVKPPAGAGALKVTLQAVVPRELRLDGLQDMPLGVRAARIATVAVAVCVFSTAVTVAVRLLIPVPAVAVNAAVLALAAIVTLAGTGSIPELLDTFAVTAFTAVLVRVSVHVEICPASSEFGEQPIDDN
jgi:hypothetical protein